MHLSQIKHFLIHRPPYIKVFIYCSAPFFPHLKLYLEIVPFPNTVFSHNFSSVFNNYLTRALLMGIYVISNFILFQLVLWQIILCIFSAILCNINSQKRDGWSTKVYCWIATYYRTCNTLYSPQQYLGQVVSVWVVWISVCIHQSWWKCPLITLLTRVTNSFKVIAIYIYI